MRIPAEFRYWDRVDRPRVRRLRDLAKRWLGRDLAPDDAVVRDFAAMYFAADPVCEAFVADAYRSPKEGRELLERALAAGTGALPDAPASLRALFDDIEHDPEWLDWALVERGARAFRRYGVAVFRFAGAITLEGYRESSVAKPLALTGIYAGDSTKRRFMETVAFWIAVSEPGGLRPGAAGRASALRVRVMHVFVRKKLLAHPDWQLERWGVPISQADALLTLLGGSFAPAIGMTALGYLPTEIGALLHFWRYVGHLMGVRPRRFPTSAWEAAQLAFVNAIKGASTAGDDGRHLIRSYAAAFAPGERRGWRDALEDGLHRGYTQLFTTAATRRANQLAPATGWVLAALAPMPFVLAGELLRRVSPALDERLDRRARTRRRRWFERHMGGRDAEYRPAERFTR